MKKQHSVFITGTSSGIGRATAREMKKAGGRVFASARKTADLKGLEEEGFEAIELDMTDTGSKEAAAKMVLDACDNQLDALVNNAGYGQPGALEDLSILTLRKQFEVNVIGLQHLTNLCLPSMITHGRGRIVHISSVVGRVSLPFMGVYSASKFAVEALADAQRVELQGTGVWVSLVEPGPITTKFSKNAVKSSEGNLPSDTSRFSELYRKELQNRENRKGSKPFSLPPEAVARKVSHALTSTRPLRRYKVTLPAHLGALLSRSAPDALIDWILGWELKQRR